MTASEINALQAGPEMDAAVAREVMGWHLEIDSRRDHHRCWLNDSGGHECCERGYHPSTDWDSAFEIAKELRISLVWSSGKWMAFIASNSVHYDPWRGRINIYTANVVKDESACVAICKVALLLKAKE